MIRLILTANISDLYIAFRDTPIFTGYLLARGYDATYGSTLEALLRHRPWRETGHDQAPWRIVAANLPI